MIFKQYTLNGKRRVSNGKRHVIQRKQTRENVCGLCLNANSCNNTTIETSIFVHFQKNLYFAFFRYSYTSSNYNIMNYVAHSNRTIFRLPSSERTMA